MAKEALEKAGHTLVPYKIPDIELVMELVNKGDILIQYQLQNIKLLSFTKPIETSVSSFSAYVIILVCKCICHIHT